MNKNINFNKEKNNKQLYYGVIIVIGIAISSGLSTQLSQQAQISVKSTFFIIWFGTSLKILCAIPYFIKSVCKNDIGSHRSFFSSIKYFSKYVVVFYILLAVSNYLYVKALSFMSASLVSVLFSSCNGWVVILSLFLLKEKISLLKMTSVFVSVSGIVFIFLHDVEISFSFHSAILVTLFPAFCTALYKVLFKKIYNDMSVWDVCIFSFTLGLFNLLFMWWLVIILYIFNYESLPDTISDYMWLLGVGIVGTVVDFLINLGVTCTNPLFISIGIILAIPANIIIDLIIHNIKMNALQLLGTLCIMFGFGLLVLHDYNRKNQEQILEETSSSSSHENGYQKLICS